MAISITCDWCGSTAPECLIWEWDKPALMSYRMEAELPTQLHLHARCVLSILERGQREAQR